MLYTIIPEEYVLGLQDGKKHEIIQTNAGFLETMNTPQGTMVSRLISTDPRSYLNPRFAPGSPWDGEPAGEGRIK